MKVKKYRKIVREQLHKFPPCIKEVMFKEYVLGSDIIKEGVETIEGKPVDSDLKYVRSKISPEWIDHEKEAMRFCKKYGEKGLMIYAISLRAHLEKMKQKYPAFFPSQGPRQIQSQELEAGVGAV